MSDRNNNNSDNDKDNHPLLFQPSVWLPPHVNSNREFAHAIETKMPHILRNHDKDPQGAWQQAQHIIYHTMGVEQRHLVRPLFGMRVACSKISSSNSLPVNKEIQWLELEVSSTQQQQVTSMDLTSLATTTVNDMNVMSRMGFTRVVEENATKDNNKQYQQVQLGAPASFKTTSEGAIVLCVPLLNTATTAICSIQVGEELLVDGLPELTQPLNPQMQRDIFIKLAQKHAVPLMQQALDEAGLKAQEVDYVILSSHQPYPFPALYHYLSHLLPFGKHCQPVVTQAGCAASAVALDLAHTLLKAQPHKNVLLVSLEFCSLGFRPHKKGMSVFLNAALFGDAATASVMRGAKTLTANSVPRASKALKVLCGRQECVSQATHVSYFDYDHNGFHFVTTAELCRVVAEYVPGFCQELSNEAVQQATELQSTNARVAHIVHPGGAKMVDSMEQSSLDISQESITRMRTSLREGGNLASSTIMRMTSLAWEELNSPTVLVAMGPGFHMAGIGTEPVDLTAYTTRPTRSSTRDWNTSSALPVSFSMMVAGAAIGVLLSFYQSSFGIPRASLVAALAVGLTTLPQLFSFGRTKLEASDSRGQTWQYYLYAALLLVLLLGSVLDFTVFPAMELEDLTTSTNTVSTTASDLSLSNELYFSTPRLYSAVSVILDGPPDKEFARSPAMLSARYSEGKYGTTVRSQAQLHADADRAAAILRHVMPLGETSNERVMVAVSEETTYEGYVLMLACFKNAYLYANVARQLWHPRFGETMEMIDPAVIVVDSLTLDRYPFLAEVPTNKTRVILAMDSIPDLPSLFGEEELPWDAYVTPPLYTTETFPLEKEATLTYTSGSTGLPKVVASSFRSILFTAFNSHKLLSHDISSRILTPLAYDDSAGMDNVYIPSLIFGGCIMPTAVDTYEKASSPHPLFLYALHEESATAAVLTPHQLDEIVDYLDDELHGEEMNDDREEVLQQMQTIVTVGSKLLPVTTDNALQFFARPDGTFPTMVETYGTSEAHLLGYRDIFDSHALTLAPGVEVRIEPFDNNFTSNQAPLGSIFLRSNQMMMGYLNKDDQSPIDSQGWYATGDVGYLTGESKLTITGRSRASINFGGDEYDRSVLEKVWAEMLPTVKELVLVRDSSHEDAGESAVLFCRDGQHNSLDSQKSDAQTNLKKTVLDTTELSKTHKIALMLTSAVCFVDEFPRVVRDKINAPEVERLYTEDVKPSMHAQSNGLLHEDIYHIAVLSLEWDQEGREWDILEVGEMEVHY